MIDWRALARKALSAEELAEYERLRRTWVEKSTGECLCGGIAGHVPNGTYCRRPLVPEK